MTLRYSKRGLLARGMDLTGCGRLLRAAGTWRGVLLLMYHRIGHPADSLFDHELWSATADQLDEQLTALRATADVISLGELGLALHERRGRSVMLTFDDGYRDNFSTAFPILTSHGVPATFFITTGFIDDPRVPWWDEIAWMLRTSGRSSLPATRWLPEPLPLDTAHRDVTLRRLQAIYKALPGHHTEDYLDSLGSSLETGRCPATLASDLWMTWEMLRQMKRHRMAFGGHTVSHPILANLSPERQHQEIVECRRRLVDELGEPIDALAYPEGRPSSFNETTRAALREHGYRWAFVSSGGYCRFRHGDPYAVHRVAVEVDTDAPLFQATLALPQLFA